jgi:hypothetical protein
MSLHSINWKQTAKVGCDPTVHEFQTVGHEPTLLAQPPVHGFAVPSGDISQDFWGHTIIVLICFRPSEHP